MTSVFQNSVLTAYHVAAHFIDRDDPHRDWRDRCESIRRSPARRNDHRGKEQEPERLSERNIGPHQNQEDLERYAREADGNGEESRRDQDPTYGRKYQGRQPGKASQWTGFGTHEDEADARRGAGRFGGLE